jgi:hypothetical protein
VKVDDGMREMPPTTSRLSRVHTHQLILLPNSPRREYG